jgi:hypothetical protein
LCDNSYHAVTKEAERASRPDGASDAEITIRTMHYLLNVKAESVRSFWRRNFMLDQEKPALAAYVDMLKGNDKMPQKENYFTTTALRHRMLIWRMMITVGLSNFADFPDTMRALQYTKPQIHPSPSNL